MTHVHVCVRMGTAKDVAGLLCGVVVLLLLLLLLVVVVVVACVCVCVCVCVCGGMLKAYHDLEAVGLNRKRRKKNS